MDARPKRQYTVHLVILKGKSRREQGSGWRETSWLKKESDAVIAIPNKSGAYHEGEMTLVTYVSRGSNKSQNAF